MLGGDTIARIDQREKKKDAVATAKFSGSLIVPSRKPNNKAAIPIITAEYCTNGFRCNLNVIDSSPESFHSLFNVSQPRIKSGDEFLIRITLGRIGGFIVNFRLKVGESKGNCLDDIPGEGREIGSKLRGERPRLNGTRSVSMMDGAYVPLAPRVMDSLFGGDCESG